MNPRSFLPDRYTEQCCNCCNFVNVHFRMDINAAISVKRISKNLWYH